MAANDANDAVLARQRGISRWVETMREVAALRSAALRTVDTAAALKALSGAFRLAKSTQGTRLDSGLVEQQRWFSRAHDRPA